jgi:ABC-type transport system substrate-binding protein
MYSGGYGGLSSGYAELVQFWGESPLPVNTTSFRSADYDRAFLEFLASGDAATQVAASRKMSEIVRTYVPVIPLIFRLENDLVQPWLKGFAPQVFSTYWKYLDIDLARQKQAGS